MGLLTVREPTEVRKFYARIEQLTAAIDKSGIEAAVRTLGLDPENVEFPIEPKGTKDFPLFEKAENLDRRYESPDNTYSGLLEAQVNRINNLMALYADGKDTLLLLNDLITVGYTASYSDMANFKSAGIESIMERGNEYHGKVIIYSCTTASQLMIRTGKTPALRGYFTYVFRIYNDKISPRRAINTVNGYQCPNPEPQKLLAALKCHNSLVSNLMLHFGITNPLYSGRALVFRK